MKLLEVSFAHLSIEPTNVFVSDNTIYFTFSNKVFRLHNNQYSIVAGNGHPNYHNQLGEDKLAKEIALNPKSIFVHSESKAIYISEGFRIIKVERDGKFKTIAGMKDGYNNDGIEAIKARLKNVKGIYLHGEELFFADEEYYKVKKIGLNGMIKTIIGSGQIARHGHETSNSLDSLYSPQSVIVSACGSLVYVRTGDDFIYKMGKDNILTRVYCGKTSGMSINCDGELFVADIDKNQVVKIGLDGSLNIIVSEKFNSKALIVDERLKSPNSIFVTPENDLYVTCGSLILFITNSFYQKKYERDQLPNYNLIVCKNVMKLKSLLFYDSIIENKSLLDSLSEKQEEVIQNLIDYLIYGKIYFPTQNFNPVDVLVFLGISKTSQLHGIETTAMERFIEQCNTNPISILEKIHEIRKNTCFHSDLLDQLLLFTCKKIIVLSKTNSSLEENPLLESYTKYIIIAARSEAYPSLTINYAVNRRDIPIATLFNDKETSDIIITIDSQQFYCHKTILSSSSSYFETLFKTNFQDSTTKEYHVITEEFEGILHETVIKFCYGIQDKTIIRKPKDMLLCSNFYGAERLSEYCVHYWELTMKDFYEIAQKFSHLNNPSLNEKLESLALDNLESIMERRENWDLIPEPLRGNIMFKHFKSVKK